MKTREKRSGSNVARQGIAERLRCSFTARTKEKALDYIVRAHVAKSEGCADVAGDLAFLAAMHYWIGYKRR